MRYNNCSIKLVSVSDKTYKAICPKSLEVGQHALEYGTSMEFAQINGNCYGWSINGLPILKKETDHGVYIEEYTDLQNLLETSSFWTAEVSDGNQETG